MNKSRLVFLLLYTLFFSNLVCYDDGEEWYKTYGGIKDDFGFDAQQTLDGGYIIVGYTESFGLTNFDVYIVKTDASGNMEWNKTFGGFSADRGFKVELTNDGGFIFLGSTSSFGFLGDILLIKMNSSGDVLWSKNYGGNNVDGGNSIQQTIDGGYIITGNTWSFGAFSSDVYLVKVDESGNLQWQSHYGGPKAEYGTSVKQTNDGGYIISGTTDSFGAGDWHSDFYLIKTDGLGNMQWNKTYKGLDVDLCYSIEITSDNGYILSGCTGLTGGLLNIYLIKTDFTGNMLWNKTYGIGTGYSIKRTIDDCYVVCGYTSLPTGANTDVYLMKIDSLGNMFWNVTLGGPNYDLGYAVQQTSDGDYITIGYTNSYGSGKYDVFLALYKEPKPNIKPLADAGRNKTEQAETAINFDGSNSTDVDGEIVNYVWDFGDGTPLAYGVTTTHIYDSQGVYTVTLTVTDDDNETDEDIVIITVTPANIKPKAIAGEDKTCISGTQIVFDGSNSTDTDGVIASYSWDFGDGSPIATDKIVNHVFTSHGNYTVKLTVTDDKGATDIDEIKITINKAPIKGSIKIMVKNSSNNPLSGISVTSTTQPTGQNTLTGTTDSEGSIKFENVEPGKYVFKLEKSGYVTKNESVESVLEENVEKTIQLEAQPSVIPGYPLTSIIFGLLICLTILIFTKGSYKTKIIKP